MEGRRRKKIGLVLSGAVSLGSFEAGVAYELVKHIQESPNPDFEIDVITGSSAGALTGALVALILTTGADPEILKEAWLSVNINELLDVSIGEKSLLSGQKIEQIIARYIGPRALMPRPCNKVDQIDLAVVVTNLDGIRYSIQKAKDPNFYISAIGYEDAIHFKITEEFNDWDKLRNAVRASSAFPGAFSHKKLLRDKIDYKRTKAKANFTRSDSRYFNCSDGGIVNNQPLSTAIDIVNDLPYDPDIQDTERVFLVVDPTPPEDEGEGKDYTVFDVATKALWTIPRNQTIYKDLLLLEKINRRIVWKNSMISLLAGACNNQNARLVNQNGELDKICREVANFKGTTILGLAPEEYLASEKVRLSKTYREHLSRVRDRDLFLKYCFLLEQVSDLRNKYEVTVEMIKPQNPEQELSGVIFGSFGGFLDQDFMRHDFEVGCHYSRRWIKMERDINSLLHLRKAGISTKVQKRVMQRLLDNSVPLLIEDIGPHIFGGSGFQLTGGIKAVEVTGMMVKSVFRYVGSKIKQWGSHLLGLNRVK